LASQKVGNYPNKNQSFGHDQKIGRVCFGSNPSRPEDSTVKTVSVIATVGIQSVKRGAGEDRRDAATHK
jgi:hypothetical protein